MSLAPHWNDTIKRTLGHAKSNCTKMGPACGGITCSSNEEDCVLATAGAQPTFDNQRRIAFVKKYGPNLEGYTASLEQSWGYLLRQNIAPVLVSEFGFSHQLDSDPEAQAWLNAFSAYAGESGPMGNSGGMDWAYWEISGEQEGGTGREAGSTESYGVFNHCFTGPSHGVHFSALEQFMTQGKPVTAFGLQSMVGGEHPTPSCC